MEGFGRSLEMQTGALEREILKHVGHFQYPSNFGCIQLDEGTRFSLLLEKCSVVCFKNPSPENFSETGQVAPTMSETSSQLEVPGQFLFGTTKKQTAKDLRNEKKTFRKMPLIQKDWRLD
jgi:hypothetical protein